MRTLWPLLMGFSVVLGTASAGAQAEKEIRLDIQSQVLADALNEWAQAAGFRLIGPASATLHLPSPRLQGTFTPRAALDRLLAGTALTYAFLDDRTVAIQERLPASMQPPTPVASQHVLRLSQVDEAQRSNDGGIADSENRAIPPANERESDNGKRQRAILEEIIVTAQKREERLIDVPMSITAVSAEQLQAARIANTLDLSFAAPGLAVAELGPGRQIIVIRGLGSERGSSSLTGVYLDEMPVSGAQDGFVQSYIDLRTTDLERVEVLKGPQGTLFGEGSVGGTLRFITKDPVLDSFGGSVNTSLYSTSDGDWSEEIVGVGNIPLVKDVLALRVAATYENKSGWIDQPSIGRKDINDNEVLNTRVKVQWEPTPELKVKGMVVVHRNDGGGSNVVNQEPREDSNFLQVFDGQDRAAPSDFSDEYELYNLTATYDFGFAELLSSTSRADMDSVQSFTQLTGTLPVPELEILARDYTLNSTITSQEVRLTSSGDGPINWTIGGFYKDAEIDQSFPSGVDLVLFSGALTISSSSGGAAAGKSESLAGFSDLSYAATQRLKIGGGFRYFYDKRESFNPADVSGTFLSSNFDALTFRAYASYALAESSNVYVNVGNGARSGGFNEPGFIAQGVPATYDPESVLSVEAGIKSVLFDQRVSLEAALFYSEYQDMQENTIFLSPVTGEALAYTANDQTAELRGGEWALSWRATADLTLAFSGDVIRTEITERSLASPFDEGDPINFVPKYKLVATAAYQFDWAASVRGFFRADFSRQGKSFSTVRRTDLVASPQNIAPEVDFLNVSIGAEYNDWEMTVFGRNLTDERSSIRAGWTGLTSQARPRTIGVTIGKKF